MRATLLLATLPLLFLAAPVAAQQQTAAQQSSANVMSQGVLDGEAAAETVGSGGYFAGGLLGGVTLGLIGTGVAYAVAANSSTELPAAQRAELDQREASYVRGYREAFSDEVRSKRKTAALGGGLLGTAVIVSIILAAGS